MHVFYFIAAFLLLTRLSKSFIDPVLKIKWSRMITYANVGIGALFLVSQINFGDAWQSLFSVAVLAGILYYLQQEPDFAQFKFFIQAHYPLIVVGIIDVVT